MPDTARKVTVTIDGVVYQISQGTQTFVSILAAAGINASTKTKITVSSTPAEPTVINPNSSMAIRGGEVFTTA